MRIDAALDGYWRERATNAPDAENLRHYLNEESDFAAAARKNP